RSADAGDAAHGTPAEHAARSAARWGGMGEERRLAPPHKKSRRRDFHRLALTAALLTLAVLWLLPVVWVVVTSLKLTPNIVRVPPDWIPWPPTLEHYREVLFSSSRTARIG